MPANILIVDDEMKFERLMRQLFRKELRREEYTFMFAHNGLHALKKINDAPEDFDLVLCDINMPEMDGLTFISELKKVNPDLLPVVVSAYGNMGNIRAAMNLGAFDFVTKPVEFDDLKATIHKVLGENEIRVKAQKAQKLEYRNQQLEELDELKSRFFTNISHELRTPVTIIDGMIDQIRKNPSKWLVKGGRIVKRNSSNLLNLINQILDLRKLEMGKLKLSYTQGDIIAYLRVLIGSFHSYTENRDIKFLFKTELEELVTAFDAEKLLRILSNLISNAIKFTPQGGKINVVVSLQQSQQPANSEDELNIQVIDTGVGIPAEKIPYIFDRFYQVDDAETRKGEGTGIGLTIVKEFVKMMNGQVFVESQKGTGTTFTLLLPLIREYKEEQPIPGKNFQSNISLQDLAEDLSSESGLIAEPSNDSLPHLLIVEDNPDITQYLVSLLEGQYQISTAENGQIGVDMALSQIPDLIISDLMMPQKNGYELCKELKTDERTSHIPIILLTAKTGEDARIEGLESGADAYLPKPFNHKELETRLRKLWELRMNLQLRYRSLENLDKAEGQAKHVEDIFMLKFKEIVEDNLSDENFGVPEMCEKIGLSRSSLHRKVKALTDRSTSLMIRSVRLEHAKTLLKSSYLNISQIAYEVGFKDPRYFSRTFFEEFGKKPSEFKEEGS